MHVQYQMTNLTDNTNRRHAIEQTTCTASKNTSGWHQIQCSSGSLNISNTNRWQETVLATAVVLTSNTYKWTQTVLVVLTDVMRMASDNSLVKQHTQMASHKTSDNTIHLGRS